jgi:hypothetical protein
MNGWIDHDRKIDISKYTWSIVTLWFINQLRTGRHHRPVRIEPINMDTTHDLIRRNSKGKNQQWYRQVWGFHGNCGLFLFGEIISQFKIVFFVLWFTGVLVIGLWKMNGLFMSQNGWGSHWIGFSNIRDTPNVAHNIHNHVGQMGTKHMAPWYVFVWLVGEKLDLKMVPVAMLGVLCWDNVHIICGAYQKLPWHQACEDREDIDMKHVARLLPASSRSHVAAKNLLSALQKYPEDAVRDVEVQAAEMMLGHVSWVGCVQEEYITVREILRAPQMRDGFPHHQNRKTISNAVIKWKEEARSTIAMCSKICGKKLQGFCQKGCTSFRVVQTGWGTNTIP